MKTKIKNCYFLFAILLAFTCYSQKSINEDMIMDVSKLRTFDLRSKALVGSSYIIEDFLLAKLSSSEKVYAMRYNAYQDEMEIDKDGVPFYIRKRLNYIVTFMGVNKVYKVYTYEVNDRTELGFFVVLNKGDKVGLLLKEKIKLYDEVPVKSGYDEYQPPTLKRIKDKLYISYNNKTAVELPNKKKEILKLFSDNAKRIDSFAKKNKLRFKKKEDLFQIFNYFNSLE